MKRFLIAGFIMLALAGAARGFGLGLGNRFGHLGAAGQPGAPVVLTNLRITNTGDFRITNTGANRAVFP